MSGGIEVNKIAGSIFLAGIIAMIAGLTAEGLYTGSVSGHEEHHAERGYSIDVPEGDEHGGAAEAKDEGPVDIALYLAAADLEAGKALMKKCTTCHSFDKGGPNGVGPNQWGLVGRKIASAPGYSYSASLQALSGSWGFQELSEFLEKPKQYAPGNKMSFAGIKKPEERANLLAYLNTLSDSPLPLPAAKPKAEAAPEAADAPIPSPEEVMDKAVAPEKSAH